MAQPITISWTELTIWPGDGQTPETFTNHVCGLTTKEFGIDAATSDIIVPDCDTPDDPAWLERIVRSLSSDFNGTGVMAQESFSFWRDWALGGDVRTVRIGVAFTPNG